MGSESSQDERSSTDGSVLICDSNENRSKLRMLLDATEEMLSWHLFFGLAAIAKARKGIFK